jgi:hypothetical protein
MDALCAQSDGASQNLRSQLLPRWALVEVAVAVVLQIEASRRWCGWRIKGARVTRSRDSRSATGSVTGQRSLPGDGNYRTDERAWT